MKAYRKRQHVVVACRWTGEHPSVNFDRILGGPVTVNAAGTGEATLRVSGYSRGVSWVQHANVGDWLVRTPDSVHATDGALEVLTNEQFEAQYEPVDAPRTLSCGHQCDWCNQRASEVDAGMHPGEVAQ